MSNEVRITKSQKWFNDNIIENKEELFMVSELAGRMISDKLKIDLTTKPHIAIIMYVKTYDAIMEVIKEKSSKFDKLDINIANRVEIGFSNADIANGEKAGNFGFHINHIPLKKEKPVDVDEDDETIQICTKWNATNIVANPEIVRSISVKAKDMIESATGLKLQDSEMVMPIFCITHDQLMAFMNIKLTETNSYEYELNVAGIFDLGIRFDVEVDEEPNIYYTTSVSSRLTVKDDSKALAQIVE